MTVARREGAKRAGVVRARRITPWLGAGALTLGVAAAVFGGAGVAGADSGDTAGTSSAGSSVSSVAGNKPSETSSVSTQSSTDTDATPKDGKTPTGKSTSPDPADDDTAGDERGATSADHTEAADTNGHADDADDDEVVSTSGRHDEITADAVGGDVATPTTSSPETASATAEQADLTVETDPAAVADGAAANPAGGAVQADKGERAETAPLTQLAGAAAASTINPVPTAWAPPSLPTPEQVIQSLQSFGDNLAVTFFNQLLGVQRNLADLSADLARIFGIREVVVTDPGPYGNPANNTQFWSLLDYRAAPLATVAMAYAQLTGTPVDVEKFINLALVTDSLSINNSKMYLGSGTTQFVRWTDSYELLQSMGVRVLTNYFAEDKQSAAFNALATGLQDPSKTMIVVIKGPVDDFADGSKTVVVLGVDNVANTVTINDPTRADGQGLTMTLDDFMSLWGSQNYQLVTTQLAAKTGANATAPRPGKTQLEWSLPRPDQLGEVLRDLGSNIVTAVVHQIDGVGRSLADLSADLARTFGLAGVTSIDPPSDGDTEYGNYAANVRYWLYQGGLQSCSLMAAAGVIGQLTGTMPTEQEILDLARSTPSQVVAGEMVFEGDGKVPGKHYGTYNVDVLSLLNSYGVNADLTTYLRSQGPQALDSMTSALSAGQGVMVSVFNNVVYNAYTTTYLGWTWNPYPVPTGILQSNHNVIVLSVDTAKNVVFLNDSALKGGQGLPVPLDKFMQAWQSSGYALITAQAVDGLATTASAVAA